MRQSYINFISTSSYYDCNSGLQDIHISSNRFPLEQTNPRHRTYAFQWGTSLLVRVQEYINIITRQMEFEARLWDNERTKHYHTAVVCERNWQVSIVIFEKEFNHQ